MEPSIGRMRLISGTTKLAGLKVAPKFCCQFVLFIVVEKRLLHIYYRMNCAFYETANNLISSTFIHFIQHVAYEFELEWEMK
jgi:hypothetical protein